MPIWCKSPSTAPLNNNLGNALASHLGIQVTFLGEDFLVANMPLTTQTSEGSGLLHGGASLALTETLG
jgi:1,4-dihydroxy-2-naphthoyl-CoA hydrolase